MPEWRKIQCYPSYSKWRSMSDIKWKISLLFTIKFLLLQKPTSRLSSKLQKIVNEIKLYLLSLFCQKFVHALSRKQITNSSQKDFLCYTALYFSETLVLCEYQFLFIYIHFFYTYFHSSPHGYKPSSHRVFMIIRF